MWGTPTASAFIIGGSGYEVNESGRNYVAHVWHEVDGFSKFGKYSGNGVSDGNFVWLGFKPAWLLVKANNSANWYLCDTARSPINPLTTFFHPDRTDADYSNFGRGFDFLSNGFKLRQNAATYNDSGDTFVYMAFAEHPFVSSKGVPVTARQEDNDMCEYCGGGCGGGC